MAGTVSWAAARQWLEVHIALDWRQDLTPCLNNLGDMPTGAHTDTCPGLQHVRQLLLADGPCFGSTRRHGIGAHTLSGPVDGGGHHCNDTYGGTVVHRPVYPLCHDRVATHPMNNQYDMLCC